MKLQIVWEMKKREALGTWIITIPLFCANFPIPSSFLASQVENSMNWWQGLIRRAARPWGQQRCSLISVGLYSSRQHSGKNFLYHYPSPCKSSTYDFHFCHCLCVCSSKWSICCPNCTSNPNQLLNLAFSIPFHSIKQSPKFAKEILLSHQPQEPMIWLSR